MDTRAEATLHRRAALERVDVILPAGGRIDGEFAQRVGTEVKALARFAGETILQRTVNTLRTTGSVRRIVVIGGDEAKAEALACGADGAPGASGPAPDGRR